MTFVPFHDKIEVRPIKVEDSPILRDSNNFQEAGEVLALGAGVDSVDVGDIVFFLSHGCWETTDTIDGEKHWVVPATEEYILGRIPKEDVAEKQV